MTRAFPVGILALPLAVSFVRLGIYDTRVRRRADAHRAGAALRGAGHVQPVPRHPARAGGGRLGVRLLGPGRFRRVVLPLALPGIAATAIFAFVISWNEVFAASVLTVRNKTLTAYLLTVLSEARCSAQLAGGLLLILPSVFFIFLVRRYLFAMWGIASR